MPQTRKQLVFFILGGFFLTNAIVAELTGGKLFQLPYFTFFGQSILLSIGVIPWPVVFITTDLINEYFGKTGVRKLTLLAVVMIAYSYLILFASIRVPAAEGSPVPGSAFAIVFGQSQWIIVGSLTAFVTAQFVDVLLFSIFKKWTGHKLLWLRSTGSTVFSQIVDTFLVGYIAFVIPGKMAMRAFIPLAIGNYSFKLLVAIAITPIIYLGHGLIDRYLERDPRHTLPSTSGPS